MFRGSVKSIGYTLHSNVSFFNYFPVRHRVPSHFSWSLHGYRSTQHNTHIPRPAAHILLISRCFEFLLSVRIKNYLNDYVYVARVEIITARSSGVPRNFVRGVQQMQLRTEKTGIWWRYPPSHGFWRQLYFGTRNFISYSEIFLIFGTLRLFVMTTSLFVIANVKQLRT